jgi:hypothetical protein
MCWLRAAFAAALDCIATRTGESAPGQTGGAARTPCSPGLLDRSALYGVLAEIEGLGLGVLEVCQLTRTANNQDQVTSANRDGG